MHDHDFVPLTIDFFFFVCVARWRLAVVFCVQNRNSNRRMVIFSLFFPFDLPTLTPLIRSLHPIHRHRQFHDWCLSNDRYYAKKVINTCKLDRVLFTVCTYTAAAEDNVITHNTFTWAWKKIMNFYSIAKKITNKNQNLMSLLLRFDLITNFDFFHSLHFCEFSELLISQSKELAAINIATYRESLSQMHVPTTRIFMRTFLFCRDDEIAGNAQRSVFWRLYCAAKHETMVQRSNDGRLWFFFFLLLWSCTLSATPSTQIQTHTDQHDLHEWWVLRISQVIQPLISNEWPNWPIHQAKRMKNALLTHATNVRVTMPKMTI